MAPTVPLQHRAERELLHTYRGQYVQTDPFGGSSESNLQKDVMAGKGESNCILESHRRLTNCQPDAEAREKRIASLSGFHHSVHSGHRSGRCLLTEPLVDGFLLKAGGRYSWPPFRQTQRERLLSRVEEVSWLETLSLCGKVNYQQCSQIRVSVAGGIFCVNMRRRMESGRWTRQNMFDIIISPKNLGYYGICVCRRRSSMSA